MAKKRTYHQGFNNGYWLGRDSSVIAQIILETYSKLDSEDAEGVRSGYWLGQHYKKAKERMEGFNRTQRNDRDLDR